MAQIKTERVPVTGAESRLVLSNTRWLWLVEAAGVLTVKTDAGEKIVLKKGFAIGIKQTDLLNLTSTKNETITLSYCDEIPYFSAGLDGNIQGQQAVGQFLSQDDYGKPIVVGMLQDNGDGTFTAHNFKTIEGDGLLVEQRDYQAGFVFQVDAFSSLDLDMKLFGTVRLTIEQLGDANLFIRDTFGQLLPIYDQYGAAAPLQGVIVAGSGAGSYYIPMTGALRFLATSDANPQSWTGYISWSPRVHVPPRAY